MQHNEPEHAGIDSVMSNLEFFASAPISIARRALALAGLIVDGRAGNAPAPSDSRGPDGRPEAGKTTDPQETATPSGDSTAAATATEPDPQVAGTPREPSAPPAAAPRAEAAGAAPEKTRTPHNPQAKATAETVHAIRREYDGSLASARELGNRYGMTAGNVEKIARRVSWKHLPAEPGEYVPGASHAAGKMNAETAQAIRREFKRTPARVLAKRHGVSVQTIRDIGNGRTWKEKPAQAAEPKPKRAPKAGTPAAAGAPLNGVRLDGARLDGARRRREARDTNLSERQVREIRRHAKTAGRAKETIAKLADEFDVPLATIEAILDRHAWGDLQPRDDEYDPVGQSVWDGRTPLS